MNVEQAVTIVNVGYRSTNNWVVSVGRSCLIDLVAADSSGGFIGADGREIRDAALVDVGWQRRCI